MGTAELTISATDATKLYEEKVQNLRTEMNHVQRATRQAVEDRDKAVSEVQELSKEKALLIEEMAETKQSKQRILDSLAESRKNVEASLAKQEKASMAVIDDAKVKEARAKEEQNKVRQLASQVDGIKQTFVTELNKIEKAITELLSTTNEALGTIPDATKS